MSHIPHHRLLPQDKAVVYDHGPTDNPHPHPVAHTMHATDARHAMATEPDRWKLDPVRPEAAKARKSKTDE